MNKLINSTIESIVEVQRRITANDSSVRNLQLDTFHYNTQDIEELKKELDKSLRVLDKVSSAVGSLKDKSTLILFKELLNNITRIRDLVETQSVDNNKLELYTFEFNPGFVQDLIKELRESIDLLKNDKVFNNNLEMII